MIGLKWTRYPPDVLPAWVAEMDYPVAAPVEQAVREAVHRGLFGYPDDRSRHELAVACTGWLQRTFDWSVDPEHVHLLPDVLKGVEIAIAEYSPAGSPVILPVPYYPPLAHVVRMCGRQLATVPTSGSIVDIEAVERAFAAGARTFVLCNPHNPLGRIARPDELRALAEVVDRNGGRVVADEVHAPLVFPGHRHTPYASLSDTAAAHTITLVSTSKGWNMPGLKCAQAITGSHDHALWSALPTVRTWGASTLGITAATAAYRDGGPWLAQVLRELDANRHALAELLTGLLPEVGYRPPEGTYLAWLDCRPLRLPEEPADFFLRRARVALSGGASFAAPGFARLNFATTRSVLERIVHEMARAVRES